MANYVEVYVFDITCSSCNHVERISSDMNELPCYIQCENCQQSYPEDIHFEEEEVKLMYLNLQTFCLEAICTPIPMEFNNRMYNRYVYEQVTFEYAKKNKKEIINQMEEFNTTIKFLEPQQSYTIEVSDGSLLDKLILNYNQMESEGK